MKKYLPAFVCGFGAGVLQVVPVAKSFSCCLIIPIAAVLALFLDQKANNSKDLLIPSKAVFMGLLTGIYAALFGSFFDIFITLVTKNNDIIAVFHEMGELIDNFPISSEIKAEVLNMLRNVVDDISATGFSWLYTFSIFINNIVLNSIFGIVGGLIGMQIINSRINKSA